MRSFAFMEQELGLDFYYEVVNEINKLKWYFVKFAGTEFDEAMQKTLMHTLTHFRRDKGDMFAYLKKLAREICKNPRKEIPVEIIERTLADGGIIEDGTLTPTVDTGRINDFSSDVINKIMEENDDMFDAIQLALDFSPSFVNLCSAFRRMDSSTMYYPDIFKHTVNKLCRKHNKSFMQMCMKIYDTYNNELTKFLTTDETDFGEWREADLIYIRNNVSKRVKLLNRTTGAEVEDADFEPFVLEGRLVGRTGDKRVFRVEYESLWEELCDLADEDGTNQVKLSIADHYIIRTLGGSESIIDIDLYSIYDLFRSEILTNILRDTNARVINIGSKHFYLLCDNRPDLMIKERQVRGIPIKLVLEDITDSVI